MTHRDLSGDSTDFNQERYRFLIEHSGEMISSHRPGDWAYTAVSPAIQPLCGYSPEEVLGKSAYDFFHPEDAQAMKKKLIPAIYRHGIRTFRYRHKTKRGDYQWVESTHRSIRDKETGELSEIIAVTRDITPQVEAEQALREHQAELAHMSRLMSLGEMASGLAHEINQPLATTLNYANGALRILEREGSIPQQKLQTVLQAIARQSQRAAEIVKRLRGLVKKTPYQRSPVELKPLCEDVISFLQHELFELSIESTLSVEVEGEGEGDTGVEITGDEIIVEADRIQIEQVLVNLLRNAIEAYREKNNSDKKFNKTIHIKLILASPYVILRITDFAGGVSPELQKNIFEPYVTSKNDGLGMGLSISRSIIEAHGGQIRLQSDGETYTSFELQLALLESSTGINKSIL